jgi:NAD(P)-dependent dehydrogenase (short-subunit alcohol dehydrogenase family)
MSLKNKVVLVTGSSRGIGRETAIAFSGAGASVIVHGHAETENLQSIFDQLQTKNSNCCKISCELSDATDIRSMFQTIQERYGRLDVLVNNAVWQNRAPFIEMTEQDWDLVIQVNLKAPFLCSQLAAKMMIGQGGGKIINVGSVHESHARRFYAHYSSSKGGLLMLTRAMALELAEYNIQVNQVTPGAIATDLTDPERQEKFLSAVPAGRVGKTREIADMICYLASGKADYITGTSITVDGGLTLGFCASRPDL